MARDLTVYLLGERVGTLRQEDFPEFLMCLARLPCLVAADEPEETRRSRGRRVHRRARGAEL